MIHEKFYDLTEHFFGWRCVICGEIVDQMILEHRHWMKTMGGIRGKREAAKLGDD